MATGYLMVSGANAARLNESVKQYEAEKAINPSFFQDFHNGATVAIKRIKAGRKPVFVKVC